MIWHYTSFELLNEFIKPNAKLYATHFSYVNDTQDCRVASKVLASVMAARIQWWRGAMQTPAPEVMAHEIERGLFMPRFMACFSRKADDLSQWRGYASKRGVSIGFDEQALKEAVGRFVCYPARISVGDCIYKSPQELDEEIRIAGNEVREILCRQKSYVDTLCKYIDGKRVSPHMTEDQIAEFAEQYKKCWLESLRKAELSVFWKHNAFQAEEEVRLAVIFDGPQPLRCVELIGGIPRVAVPLTRPLNSLVKEIIVGPDMNSDSDFLTAQTLAFKYGLRIRVSKSQIPYRSRFK